MKNICAIIVTSLIYQHVHQCVGEVGVSFSPFVRTGDRADTTTYSPADITVMLELIVDKGYRKITTHGVGVLGPNYHQGQTWRQSASVVHTAVAAAEINKKRNSRTLTLQQGLYRAADSKVARAEIDVGFEMADKANNIFTGTVTAMIFPSIAGIGDLIRDDTEILINSTARRCREKNLKFGIRLWECSGLGNSDPRIVSILSSVDFITCIYLPTDRDFNQGWKLWETSVIRQVNDAFAIVRQKRLPFEIMVETGWPGTSTSVGAMHEFWRAMENWGIAERKMVYLHEAFDNPWKSSMKEIARGGEFGLWSHNHVGDMSKGSYILKTPKKPEPSHKSDGDNANSSSYTGLIIGLIVGTLFFIALVVIVMVLYKRLATKIVQVGKLTKEEIAQFLEGATGPDGDGDATNNPWSKAPYNRDFEIDKNKFNVDYSVMLGSGQFGSVYKGKITGMVGDVAFKTTKADCPVTALRGLLSEIKILTFLGTHRNVVSICGAHTAGLDNGIVFMAIELCVNGSLEKFLRNRKFTFVNVTVEEDSARYVNIPENGTQGGALTTQQLFRWSQEIASAMEYISSKHVIYADLATRNVLLTADLTAKVTDFGLSRRLYEYTEYVKKNQEPLPWRWMAVESLKVLEFSTKSDVWSYGVVLWEIFSLGDVPYPGLTWDMSFVSQLENGLRMVCPPRATMEIYKIMEKCWLLEPSQRPTFEGIKTSLNTIHRAMFVKT